MKGKIHKTLYALEINIFNPEDNFQIAKEFLKMEKPNKMILEKLIERIEFDKEKNIKIKFTFQNYPNVRIK